MMGDLRATTIQREQHDGRFAGYNHPTGATAATKFNVNDKVRLTVKFASILNMDQAEIYTVTDIYHHGYRSFQYKLNEFPFRFNEENLMALPVEPAPTINRITRDDVKNFNEWYNNHNSGLNAYQTIATKSAIYPGQGTPLGLVYVALKLVGEAGEHSEHVGKAMRDDGLIADANNQCGRIEMQYPFTLGKNVTVNKYAELTSERRTAIIKELGDILWYLSAQCNELGIKLSEVALTNLEKLCDRTERDALRGSGDER